MRGRAYYAILAGVWVGTYLIIVGCQLRSVLALSSESDVVVTLPDQSGGVEFAGDASPAALVTVLRNGLVIGTALAGSDSSFDITIGTQPPVPATYSVYANDGSGRQTGTQDFNLTPIPQSTVGATSMLLSPTIAIEHVPIKRPQTQNVFGSGRQDSTVTSFFSRNSGGDNFSVQTTTTSGGDWSAQTTGRTLHLGTYDVSSLLQSPSTSQSPLSPARSFQVQLSADLNSDSRVNLTDFSILMFYYNTNTTKPADINDDGRVNLTDFSILLFYWTG